MKTSALPIFCVLAMVSCRGGESAGAENGSRPTVMERPSSAIDANKPETLVGQPLEKVQAAADAAGIRHRVIERDGQPQRTTRDFIPSRLNFVVREGIVTAVTKG